MKETGTTESSSQINSIPKFNLLDEIETKIEGKLGKIEKESLRNRQNFHKNHNIQLQGTAAQFNHDNPRLILKVKIIDQKMEYTEKL